MGTICYAVDAGARDRFLADGDAVLGAELVHRVMSPKSDASGENLKDGRVSAQLPMVAAEPRTTTAIFVAPTLAQAEQLLSLKPS